MKVVGMLGLLIVAILINLLYTKTGLGRADTWTVTVVIFAATLVLAGFAGKERWDGIFIDRDNRISLSRFQLILWTVLLVATLLCIGLTNVVVSNKPPLDITIPPQIWGLLGLGAFTAVAAPAIKDGRRNAAGANALLTGADETQARRESIAAKLELQQNLKSSPHFEGDVLTKAQPGDARWVDLFMGDNEGSAYVDISKLQQLAFTLLVIVVYASDIWQTMGTRTFISGLPGASAGFLALLGISHTAYLADKQLAST